jgi:hypothetical protein
MTYEGIILCVIFGSIAADAVTKFIVDLGVYLKMRDIW